MSTNRFTIDVVAADRKLFSGEAFSLVAPGIDGYFGVLRGHAPLVAALRIGEITITPPVGPQVVIAVSGGFIEVMADHVTILADAAELAAEIDVERALHAKERAERRLHERETDIDVDRAQAALARSINRLRVVGQGGR